MALTWVVAPGNAKSKGARVPNPAAGDDDPADNDQEIARRLAKLTSGQLDCLRLVDEHMSSKEIAVRLGISSHTVDQRIRGALHILGVERRSQAARLVAQHPGEYQRLIHQPATSQRLILG